MTHIMSSYNHSTLNSSVSHHVSLFHVLEQSGGRSCLNDPLTPLFPSELKIQDSSRTGLPCNTLTEKMAADTSNALSPDSSMSTIADLIRSDDQFLDQLEVMHYLNFSDW